MADSVEKKQKKISKGVYIRIAIIILLLIAALLINIFRKNTKANITKTLGLQTAEESKSLVDNIQQGAQDILDNTIKKSEQTMGEVLGEAQNLAVKTASDSAEKIKDFVFDNTVGTILKQIDKLPEDQKEDIKRNVCK